MVFIRKKKVNGREYYYAVTSTRVGNNVRKFERYIGLNPPSTKELENINQEFDKTKAFLHSVQHELDSIKRGYNKKRTHDEQQQLEDELIVRFTYDTSRIEGSSLSYKDTKMLLQEGITPREKPVRDIREAQNHRNAYLYLKQNLKGDINKQMILMLHGILKEGVTEDAGNWRTGQVLVGDLIPIKADLVESHIDELVSWYSRNERIHPLELATIFHCGFERIHPFFDGNGRVGRLLLGFILMKKGYPPVIIQNRNRRRYYNALRRADDGDYLYMMKYIMSEMRVMLYWR
jgi:Fic family protein